MPVLSNAVTGRVSLRTFLWTRILLGFYCPLGARASRCLWWFYCLCFGHALTILLITGANEIGSPLVFSLYIVIDYSSNVIISLLTGEGHFFNYLKGIESIDREMGTYLPLITPAIEITYLIIIVKNIAISFLHFIMGRGFSKLLLSIMVCLTGLNLNSLIVALRFDLLRVRLRLLRQGLEVKFNNSSLNNTNDQIAMLLSGLKLYKKMLDNFFNTFNWTKLRIIIGLSCNYYAFLANGYRFMSNLTSVRDIEGSGILEKVRALDYIFNIVMPCLALVLSELASHEYEQLKITIGNLLLNCDENELRKELEMAAEYLEQRPLKVTILRVVTVDGSLVLAYLGLCTTSLIIIIQTTGLI